MTRFRGTVSPRLECPAPPRRPRRCPLSGPSPSRAGRAPGRSTPPRPRRRWSRPFARPARESSRAPPPSAPSRRSSARSAFACRDRRRAARRVRRPSCGRGRRGRCPARRGARAAGPRSVRVQAVEVLVHELRAAGRALQLTDQRRDLAAQVGERKAPFAMAARIRFCSLRAASSCARMGGASFRVPMRRLAGRSRPYVRSPTFFASSSSKNVCAHSTTNTTIATTHSHHAPMITAATPTAAGTSDVDRLGQRVDGERPAQVGPRDLLPGHAGEARRSSRCCGRPTRSPSGRPSNGLPPEAFAISASTSAFASEP